MFPMGSVLTFENVFGVSPEDHMGVLQTKTLCYCSLCRFDMCLGCALVYKYAL